MARKQALFYIPDNSRASWVNGRCCLSRHNRFASIQGSYTTTLHTILWGKNSSRARPGGTQSSVW